MNVCSSWRGQPLRTCLFAIVILLLQGFGAIPALAQGASLEGTVVDPDGRPVAGAEVSVLAADGSTVASVITGPSGRFSVEEAPAGARVRVEAPGFLAWQRSVDPGGDDLRVALGLAAVEREIVVTAAFPEMAVESRVNGDVLRRRQENDLGEALRHQPGLDAVRRGPVNLEPAVRGLQETQVALLVDGTRTFAAGPARMDSGVSHVNPDDVSALRIVKGPYALAWGAGAMSALQVETFRPAFSTTGFDLAGRLSAGYRSNEEAGQGHGSLWGAGERFRFSLSGGIREGGDYEDGNGATVPGDFESMEGRGRIGFLVGTGGELELTAAYQGQDDIDYPGRLLNATYFKTRSYAARYLWKSDGGAFQGGLAEAYSNRKDHLMNNEGKPTSRDAPGRIPPFALRVELPTESNTTGGRFHADVAAGSWSWRLGTDAYRSEQTAVRRIFRRSNEFQLFEDVVWPDVEIEDVGIFARGILQQGDGWQLGTALRVDFVDATAGEVSPFFAANTTGDLDQSETNVSAAVNYQRQVGDAWSVTLGAGRAVRTATALERYSDRFPSSKFQLAAEFMGNPELDPEESFEIDLGAQGAFSTSQLEVGLFYRIIDDYITVAPDPSLSKRLPLSPPVVFRYVNGDRATFWGGEVSFRQQVGQAVDWWASVAYVRAEDEAFDEPVLGITPLTGRLGAQWRGLGGRLTLGAEAKLVAEQDRVASARFEQETPGYETFDLRSSFEVSPQLRLRLAVENVTDEAYAEHLNSPNPFSRQRVLEPGRTVAAGVELRF